MTRITSPAGAQSMRSPGRIPYRSAIALGTVTWYLDVTFAMGFVRTGFILTIARAKTLYNGVGRHIICRLAVLAVGERFA